MSAVRCTGLSVRFGDLLALDRVSWSLPAGSSCAVVGPNGAGKSTLLRCLLGLQRPSAGRVELFDGERPLPSAAIGYVPQVKSLDRRFPARPVDLVATGLRPGWPWRRHRDPRIDATLERVGLGDRRDRPLAALSGGELQRVYLARALIRQPRLLLLDEPATGLDLRAEDDLYDILDTEQRDHGATVIMITHDWGAAQHHADQVLVLNRTVVAAGPPATVLQEGPLAEAFGHVGHAHHMHPGPCDHDSETGATG